MVMVMVVLVGVVHKNKMLQVVQGVTQVVMVKQVLHIMVLILHILIIQVLIQQVQLGLILVTVKLLLNKYLVLK